jgi:hypothetical protein
MTLNNHPDDSSRIRGGEHCAGCGRKLRTYVTKKLKDDNLWYCDNCLELWSDECAQYVDNITEFDDPEAPEWV